MFSFYVVKYLSPFTAHNIENKCFHFMWSNMCHHLQPSFPWVCCFLPRLLRWYIHLPLSLWQNWDTHVYDSYIIARFHTRKHTAGAPVRSYKVLQKCFGHSPVRIFMFFICPLDSAFYVPILAIHIASIERGKINGVLGWFRWHKYKSIVSNYKWEITFLGLAHTGSDETRPATIYLFVLYRTSSLC